MTTRRFFSMLVSVAALLAGMAHAADDAGARTHLNPPVLMHSEPPDSAIVTLPGPPPEPVAPAAVPVATLNHDRVLDEPRPYLRRSKREYPVGFEEDSSRFLQLQIGQWKEFEVGDLLGKPLRQRPSFDDAGKKTAQSTRTAIRLAATRNSSWISPAIPANCSCISCAAGKSRAIRSTRSKACSTKNAGARTRIDHWRCPS